MCGRAGRVVCHPSPLCRGSRLVQFWSRHSCGCRRHAAKVLHSVCRELIQLRMAWQRHPGLLPELCSESVVSCAAKVLCPMHGEVFLPSHNSWLVVLFVLSVVFFGSSSAGPVNVCAPSHPSCRRAWLTFVVGCHCDLACYSFGASTSSSLFYQGCIKYNVGCSSMPVPSFVASFPQRFG
jgi:hypothetical protein